MGNLVLSDVIDGQFSL